MRWRWALAVGLVLVLSALKYSPPPPRAPLPEPAPVVALPESAAELLDLARRGNSDAFAALRSRPLEALAAIRERLCAYDYERIETVLLDLGQEPARQLLTDLLESGRCTIPPDALAKSLTQEELKALALRLPGQTSHVAFEAVQDRDPAFLEAFIARPENQWSHVLQHDIGVGVVEDYYHLLTPAGKRAFFQWSRMASETLLQKETDPGIRQELLYRLHRTDELLASLEQHGGLPGSSFWLDAAWEKQVYAEHPESYIARGVQAYDAVMGEGHYFSEGRRWTIRGRFPILDGGNRGYDPVKEIPAWLEFLERFPGHSAAGEAAYRLARCYEIEGRMSDALFWLHRAEELPNGEYAREARGRITWILDALLTDEALLTLTDFPEDLRPQVAYARALRRLRAADWAGAVDALDDVIDRHGALLLTSNAWAPPQTVGALLADQRQQAARLRALSASTDPESQYAMAATMFHDESLFTNRFWAFGRGPGFIGGFAWPAMAGDYEPQYGRWAADSSNLVQAARAFARVSGGSDELQAKAAYSRALALTKLVHPGTYINLWRSQQEIGLGAATLFEEMATRYPASDLADDALLSVAYLRRDPTYFDLLLERYPESDTAADARLRSFQGAYGLPLEVPPYRELQLREAPAALVARLDRQPLAVHTLGDYTYVLITSQPGESVELNLQPQESGALRVEVRRYERPRAEAQVRLLRFSAQVTVEL